MNNGKTGPLVCKGGSRHPFILCSSVKKMKVHKLQSLCLRQDMYCITGKQVLGSKMQLFATICQTTRGGFDQPACLHGKASRDEGRGRSWREISG